MKGIWTVGLPQSSFCSGRMSLESSSPVPLSSSASVLAAQLPVAESWWNPGGQIELWTMPASGGYLATVSVKCGSEASSITLTVVATVIASQCGLVVQITNWADHIAPTSRM